MAFALKEFAAVMMDGQARDVTSDLVIFGVLTTDNAEMEHVSALRVGMESIVLCVSLRFYIQFIFINHRFHALI